MKEEWRTVEAFPAYAVSDLGRVKRIVGARNCPAGYVLAQQSAGGYKYVGLSRGGIETKFRVNRLVCATFHGPPPTLEHHAAHNDGVRDNNAAANLRWATVTENTDDKRLHGTVAKGDATGARLHPERRPWGLRNGKHTKPECTPRGESHGNAVFTEDDVRAVRADPRPRRQIAKAYGVSKGAIDGIKSGRNWGHVA